jgi:putative membrane protein
MKTMIATMAALALASSIVPVRAETLGEKTGVNSVLGMAPTTQDFVTEAAVSDMFEVQSSKLAEERTTGPTKAFAEKMIQDHTKTTSELKPLAEKAHVAPPTALDDTHKKMLEKLQGLKGDDFAKQYHSDQDKGHEQAVSLFERYSKGGDNPEIKAWAGQTLPHLQEHLKLAQNLDK